MGSQLQVFTFFLCVVFFFGTAFKIHSFNCSIKIGIPGIKYDPKDEEIRYDDLFMVHSGKWIFIRFNPDGKGVDMEDKLTRLMEEIQIQMERIENEENTEFVDIIKLFY